MSKGFMLFVDGTGAKKEIHAGYVDAKIEMGKVCRKNVGKEVFLVKILKRKIRREETSEDVTKLATHLPSTSPNSPRKRLGLSDLVLREQTQPGAA